MFKYRLQFLYFFKLLAATVGLHIPIAWFASLHRTTSQAHFNENFIHFWALLGVQTEENPLFWTDWFYQSVINR